MTAGGGEHDQDHEGRSEVISEAGGRSETENGEVRVVMFSVDVNVISP